MLLGVAAGLARMTTLAALLLLTRLAVATLLLGVTARMATRATLAALLLLAGLAAATLLLGVATRVTAATASHGGVGGSGGVHFLLDSICVG